MRQSAPHLHGKTSMKRIEQDCITKDAVHPAALPCALVVYVPIRIRKELRISLDALFEHGSRRHQRVDAMLAPSEDVEARRVEPICDVLDCFIVVHGVS